MIFADIGIPMIFVQMPAMAFALIPIICIETFVAKRILSISFWSSLKAISLANLFSTFIAIPISWILLVFLQIAVTTPIGMLGHELNWKFSSPVWGVLGFLFTVPWLYPFEKHLYWMIPTASSILLIPSFFASIFSERWICVASWQNQDILTVKKAVFYSNLTSYIFLLVVSVVWISIALYTKQIIYP